MDWNTPKIVAGLITVAIAFVVLIIRVIIVARRRKPDQDDYLFYYKRDRWLTIHEVCDLMTTITGEKLNFAEALGDACDLFKRGMLERRGRTSAVNNGWIVAERAETEYRLSDLGERYAYAKQAEARRAVG